MRTCFVVLLLAIAFAGCKNDEARQAASSPAPTPKAAPGVQLFVDDQLIDTISPPQIASWPRIDTLVPPAARRLGTWQSIKLASASAHVDMPQPSAAHPDRVPVLFPGEGGEPAFGMFDPVELAKRGKPAFQQPAVSAVRIALARGSGRGENEHHGEGGNADPAQLQLTIKTKQGEQTLDGAKLFTLAREGQPGGGGGDATGWRLATILREAGAASYTRLLLTDERGVNLTLEKQDLDPASSVPFIKLNRQGQLRFRVFKKQGDTWQPGMDLRSLARVEVIE
jgi:hypothetical protein